MKQFHHIKYKEIDGYDEVILINHRIHRNISNSRFGNGIDKKIIKEASIRTEWCRCQPQELFQGEFCLLVLTRYQYHNGNKPSITYKITDFHIDE